MIEDKAKGVAFTKQSSPDINDRRMKISQTLYGVSVVQKYLVLISKKQSRMIMLQFQFLSSIQA